MTETDKKTITLSKEESKVVAMILDRALEEMVIINDDIRIITDIRDKILYSEFDLQF